MQNLKNILIGFLVSFIGSIPLGYLNVIGFDIYHKVGFTQTVFYLLGVIIIEFFVIYGTLLFSNKLNSNKKLLKYIESFSIFFMFILAYFFYSRSSLETPDKPVFSIINQNYFITGILYSSLNFIQIPFWLSWNLYLLNSNFIEVSQSRKYFYVFGTLAGTFCGMLVLILGLNYFTNQIDFLSKYLMRLIIPLVFLSLGIVQAVKFYKKYKT
jgi:hypothetical protein